MSEVTVEETVSASGSGEAFPLIEPQSGLWYAQRLAPENPAFNTAHALWIDGDLDRQAFCQAIETLTEQVDALTLRFHDSGGEPSQSLHPERLPTLQIIDLSADPQGDATAKAWMQRDRMTPVDPTRDPLACQALFLLGPERTVWYLRVHHLAIDGYGLALFSDRVSACYAALRQGKPATEGVFAALEPVLEEDRRYRESERRVKDAAYWHQTLQGMSEPSGLKPGFAAASGNALRLIEAIPRGWQSKMRQAAESMSLPWTDLLTALTAAYCQRMSGADEAVVGVPFMGRLGSASARVPMMIMNVLPLRVPAAADGQSVAEFVQQITGQLLAGRRHGRYRSEQIRRDLGFIGGQRRLYGPIVNVQPFYRAPTIAGTAGHFDVLSTGPVDDVNLGFRGDATTMFDLEIEANPALYSETEIRDHAARLLAFLEAAFDAIGQHRPLVSVPLASAAERRRVVYEFNATEHPFADGSLVDLFVAQMRHRPDQDALVFGNQTLSYRQLDQRTEALASQLVQLGVTADSTVAVALPRSLELVIGLLAIQRAGGAYLPLDLDHPDQRLATIIDAAQPVCALVQPADQARFSGSPVTLLATDRWQSVPAEPLDVAVTANQAAYVIYTSGSTGDPKGVVIEHRAIVNRLEWMQTHYEFDSSDRFLQKTPATFDVSVWEFFLPFLCGGTLVVAPPKAHHDPALLAELIRQQRITTVHFVPSMLATFLTAEESRGLQLRRVFCSGEELGADLRDQFHRRIDSQLHNLYGPTEAAVDVTYWPAPADDDSRPVPIGFPVWNTQLYILDRQQQPLPVGVVGDLYLGGVQLARGYLNRDDLTAQQFLPNPLAEQESPPAGCGRVSPRIYRTGDLARWRDDGAVVFLGRSDHQVKLRGLRIELGEIETALKRNPAIQRAEVIVREDRPGQKQLVAYLQWAASAAAAGDSDAAGDAAQTGSGVDIARQLRGELAGAIPEYMIPAAFVSLDHWPVTANGKLDRRALPAPRWEAAAAVPLQGPTQQTLAQLYQQTLQWDQRGGQLGADSDFFTLGGDSLLAVQLLRAIRAQWPVEIGLEAIFQTPTIAGLARLIDLQSETAQDGGSGELSPLVPLNGLARQAIGEPAATGQCQTVADSDHQAAPLFVIHPAGGICWNYRELAARLQPLRAVFGLQSPVLDASRSVPDSIEALAADYVDRVLEQLQLGPPAGASPAEAAGASPAEATGPVVHLAGWSVGGIIAQAMAVRLQQLGHRVGLVALLDSYPCECWRAEPEPDDVAALRALLAIAGEDPDSHPELDTQAKIVDYLRQGNSPLGHLSPEILQGVTRAVISTNRLVRQHYHQPMAGTLLHVRAGRDHADRPQLQSSLWQPYAQRVESIEVPFLHAELTNRDASAVIADLLAERFDKGS